MIEVLLLFQELRLGFATYGDVVSGQRKKPARAQLQGLHAELDRAERAIFRTLLNLEGRSGVGFAELARETLRIGALIGKELGDRQSKQVVQRVAEIALGSGIGVDDFEGLGVDDQGAVRRLLKGGPMSRAGPLRPPQRATAPPPKPECHGNYHRDHEQDKLIHAPTPRIIPASLRSRSPVRPCRCAHFPFPCAEARGRRPRSSPAQWAAAEQYLDLGLKEAGKGGVQQAAGRGAALEHSLCLGPWAYCTWHPGST